MAWLILLAAAMLEVTWALALKESDGFTRLVPSVVGVVTAIGSVGLLLVAMQKLPVGTAYAAWTGLGAVGVALGGILLFGDSASAARIACLTVVFAGIVGLRLVE